MGDKDLAPQIAFSGLILLDFANLQIEFEIASLDSPIYGHPDIIQKCYGQCREIFNFAEYRTLS